MPSTGTTGLQGLAQRLAEQRANTSKREETRQLDSINLDHLKAHKDVFVPDAGTSLLMRALTMDAARLKALPATICLDVGCGAGAEAVHLARVLPGSRVIACDINANALVATRATGASNDVV